MIDLIYEEIFELFNLTGASPETAAMLELVALSVSVFLVCAVLYFAYKLIVCLVRMIFTGWK